MTEAGVVVLPDSVVSKIAAGEMIERPVSVLKELVENALDAGATRITVEVEGSLDRSLTVIDDGVGMSVEDVSLAIRRHATSKIRHADDLFQLSTLGFRGEALPSIAAISALTITTTRNDDGPATQIEVVGGEVLEIREASRTRGTTVEVRDLFFNVPVRRKFMKTERGELRVAGRLLSHLALAYPSVRFALHRPSGATLSYESVSTLRERAADVFGAGTVERMLDVEGERHDISVRGLVGRPEQSRATRDYQILIVNGRPVVSPLLNHAVKMGYGDLIPADRQPMSVISVELDPGLVDANVHPTKREVKFAREGHVFEAVRNAVSAALSEVAGETGLATRGDRIDLGGPGVVREGGERSWTSPSSQIEIGGPSRVRDTGHPPIDSVLRLWAPAAPAETLGEGDAGTPDRTGAADRDTDVGAAERSAARLARPDEPKFWQLHRRYIFAQTSSGVVVIDQHAAHERILYEKALARLEGAPPSSQRLLFAEPIELTATEFDLLGEVGEELEHLGFEIEPFGGRSVIVRAIPDDVYGWDRGQLIRDVLDEYVTVGRSVRAIRERMARAFACRGAIKSGQALSPEEMRALIDALFATTTPHGDPHGRPTLVSMSLDELDRRFGRS